MASLSTCVLEFGALREGLEPHTFLSPIPKIVAFSEKLQLCQKRLLHFLNLLFVLVYMPTGAIWTFFFSICGYWINLLYFEKCLPMPLIPWCFRLFGGVFSVVVFLFFSAFIFQPFDVRVSNSNLKNKTPSLRFILLQWPDHFFIVVETLSF